eukprot:ANDGO_04927.mRNA.1 CSC1-like protein ERD4
MSANDPSQIDSDIAAVLVLDGIILAAGLVVFFSLERKRLSSVFTIPSLDTIFRKHGHDAMIYMSLQRYMIAFMVILTFVSTVVLIPVNVASGSKSDEDSSVSGSWFGSTTILRVKYAEGTLWAHCVVALLFAATCFGLAYLWESQPVVQQGITEERYATYTAEWSAQPSRTLFWLHPPEMAPCSAPEEAIRAPGYLAPRLPPSGTVEGKLRARSETCAVWIHRIPEGCRTPDALCNLLTAKIGPQVVAVKPVYDTSALFKLQNELAVAAEKSILAEGSNIRQQWTSVINAEIPKEQRAKSFALTKKFPFISRVDAFNYWDAKQQELAQKVQDEQKDVEMKKGIVFFRSSATVRAFWANKEMQPLIHELQITSSPHPVDVQWQNACMPLQQKLARRTGVQAALITLLLFAATPAALATILREHLNEDTLSFIPSLLQSFLFAYLPTILLLVAAMLLPMIIIRLTKMEGHFLKSEQNQKIMVRIFVYLILSTLVIPTMSLAIVDLVTDAISNGSVDVSKAVQQAFIPSMQVFFFTYVLQQATIGIVLGLIRPVPRILKMLSKAKTPFSAEEAMLLNRGAAFFIEGEAPEYFSVLAVAVVYSVACPLITILGTIYAIGKHVGDLQALESAYVPPRPQELTKETRRAYLSRIRLLCRIATAMILIFAIYMAAYFSTSSADGQASFLLALLIVAILGMITFFGFPRMSKLVVEKTLGKRLTSPDSPNVPYSPSQPNHFLPKEVASEEVGWVDRIKLRPIHGFMMRDKVA